MDSTELPPTNERFAALADESTPKLNEVTERPLGLVRAKPDANALLGFSTESAGSVEDMKPMLERDSVIIDFGEQSLSSRCFHHMEVFAGRSDTNRVQVVTVRDTFSSPCGLIKAAESQPTLLAGMSLLHTMIRSSIISLRLIFGEVITDVAESFEPYECVIASADLRRVV